MRLLKLFFLDKCGATALEYAMIGAIVSIAVVAGATTMGTKVDAHYTAVGSALK